MINKIFNNGSNSQLNVNATIHKATIDNSQESIEIPETSKVTMTQNEANHFSTIHDEQQELPAEKAKKVTDSLNKLLETTTTKLRYQYHEKLDKYYVTLVDSQTDEVVREIPNKKLMDIYATMLDFVGVLVDEKI